MALIKCTKGFDLTELVPVGYVVEPYGDAGPMPYQSQTYNVCNAFIVNVTGMSGTLHVPDRSSVRAKGYKKSTGEWTNITPSGTDFAISGYDLVFGESWGTTAQITISFS